MAEKKPPLTPVVVPYRFQKRLAKKSPEMQDAIKACVRQLRINSSHPSLHVHRVQHAKRLLEASVDAGNRVTFYWDKGRLVLENHCNHGILDR